MTFTDRGKALRGVVSALVRKRDIGRSLVYLGIASGVASDPVDTFDELMAHSERLGLRGTFYFLAEGHSSFDLAYSLGHPFISSLLERIRSRGHNIGLHGGYDTVEDASELRAQRERLERHWGALVLENRQHYLRFEAPVTWRRVCEAGLAVDSSCGYAELEGFRCGTGTAFPVFDGLARRQLDLMERPLVAMDGTLFSYRQATADETFDSLRALVYEARRWGSGLTLLVHNTFVRHQEFAAGYRRLLTHLAQTR
jgi:hypothetical protein